MTTAKEAAHDVLDGFADPKVLQRADEAVAAGTHTWIWDPEVPNVVGLVRTGTNRADVVVYVSEKDFELSFDWEVGL